MRVFAASAFAAATIVACMPAWGQDIHVPTRSDFYEKSLGPYVTSPQEVVDDMLELAKVRPGELVYDLGSGDGRVLITAVQRFKARAVGIELSDDLARISTEKIAHLGLQSDARVINADVRNVDLSPADVVIMYLETDSNEKLRPKLEKSLRPGTRVVSHEYKVPGWKATKVAKADPGYGHVHTMYLYRMPPEKQ
jgi:SAM-dependent methyltransferase